MGFLGSVLGRSVEGHERAGDAYFQRRKWGDAKLAYENALHKLEKKASHAGEDRQRLEDKLVRAKEALAVSHRRDGEEMLESECYEDARDMFALALDLSRDAGLRDELQGLLKQVEALGGLEEKEEIGPVLEHDEERVGPGTGPEMEDYFGVLCSTLPPDRERQYATYGKAFEDGYVALNNGEFDRAAELLAAAMAENPSPDTHIPFELASAYMNLGRTDEAETLLEEYVGRHPDALPGYQALCEIYWERKDYDRAERLLETIPEELSVSTGAFLLRGETLFQSGQYKEALAFYDQALARFGWADAFAKELAKVHEAMGDKDQARDMYGRILEGCRGCGARPDPLVKRKYADLSLETGRHTTRVLELYLTLAQEDPQNRAQYLMKASEVYESQGNREEAQRFRLLAGMDPEK
jgi:tetratricopeptide (TPR) repeat protein